MTKLLSRRVIIIVILLLIVFLLFGPINIQNKILKIIYPIKYENFVENYSTKYEVDKNLIYAIIKAESNFNENAKSSSDAIGLMQIMEITAIETARKMDLEVTEEDLFKPDLNINIGLKYFTYLLNHYNNNYPLAIIAYNAGMGNVDAWLKDGTIKEDGTDIENVPFKETNNYVRKILRDYEIYKELYN